ncbi:MAG: N-acetyl-gamma-glutamyl-phosphate reductase, partial [Mycobacteriales bacterium]
MSRVSVAGASGYVGGELLRLLLAHPDLKLATVAAGPSSAGRPVTEMHPHLPELADTTFAAPDPDALADADLAFIALPAGESAPLATELLSRGVRVVDLGADHRLADSAAWQQWYGGQHPAPDAAWPYGLPELPGTRAALAETDRVAAPGCYATAVALALAPLVAAGLVDAERIVVVAASGVSGAGRAAKPHLTASEVIGDVSAYRVGTHQHTPEIEQTLSRLTTAKVRVSFTPLLVPM